MPDPEFIVERREDLVGIVLTHAHEDHLGAVADLWPRLKAPVYATPFAASVLQAQADRRRPARRGAGHRDPARRQVQSRAVRARDDHHDAFDPRAECHGDPHKVRHGVPYRRLEDRSRTSAGRPHRRGHAEAHRRRRRASHGLRQHQRLRRGRGRLGIEGPRQPRKARPGAQGQGGRHLLRLQPRAGRKRGAGRRCCWPPSGPVGACPAAHAPSRPGMRLPARFPRMRARAAGGLPAARQGPVHLHRQPGRATGFHGEAGRAASIATWFSRRATRRSSRPA